jgi:hypothetical protein
MRRLRALADGLAAVARRRPVRQWAVGVGVGTCAVTGFVTGGLPCPWFCFAIELTYAP